MKNGFLILSLVILLLCSSSSAARLLLQKQGGDEKKLKMNTGSENEVFPAEREDFNNVKIGSETEETCDDDDDNKDEECLKRRMIAEAHLDYIYSQRHNGP